MILAMEINKIWEAIQALRRQAESIPRDLGGAYVPPGLPASKDGTAPVIVSEAGTAGTGTAWRPADTIPGLKLFATQPGMEFKAASAGLGEIWAGSGENPGLISGTTSDKGNSGKNAHHNHWHGFDGTAFAGTNITWAGNAFNAASFHKFYPRVDATAWDWKTGDLTKDDAEHVLDLSGIVPAGCVAVLLRLNIAGATSNSFMLRANVTGAPAGYTTIYLLPQVADLENEGQFTIPVIGQSIRYAILTGIDYYTLHVMGWWA